MALRAPAAIDPSTASTGSSGPPSADDDDPDRHGADAGDGTDAAADPCPAAADVVAMRATAATLVVTVATDDDELPLRALTLDRRSGRILHDGPAAVAVELPDPDFDNDSDGGRPVGDGLTVCPTGRPCVQLVPRHRRDDALARVRVRADGRVLGLAIDQGDRGARIERWDLVSNRRRGRLDLAALDPGSRSMTARRSSWPTRATAPPARAASSAGNRRCARDVVPASHEVQLRHLRRRARDLGRRVS